LNRHGRSSSLPPEDTSCRPPSPRNVPASVPTPFDNSSTHPCRGIVVDWEVETGPMGHTFPWHRVIHVRTTESQNKSFHIEIDSVEVTRAFSKVCTGTASSETCSNCSKIPRRLGELKELANDAKPHTNRCFLNYEQLTSMVGNKDSEVRKLRLRVSDFSACCTRPTTYFIHSVCESYQETRKLFSKTHGLPPFSIRGRRVQHSAAQTIPFCWSLKRC
jgi:hypothetical protein